MGVFDRMTNLGKGMFRVWTKGAARQVDESPEASTASDATPSAPTPSAPRPELPRDPLADARKRTL